MAWWSYGIWLLGSVSQDTNHTQVLRLQYLLFVASVLLVHVNNSNGVAHMYIKQMYFVCAISWRSTTCNKNWGKIYSNSDLWKQILSLLFWKVSAVINIYSVVKARPEDLSWAELWSASVNAVVCWMLTVWWLLWDFSHAKFIP